jgi:hypothetical protein
MSRLLGVSLLVAVVATLSIAADVTDAPAVAPAPNGIELPEGYRDWRVLAVSCRSDNNTIRAILGNDTAIAAARLGEILPWPDGTILAKLVWKQVAHEHWATAHVPGEFVHAEFMVKDSKRYPDTGGWGFARWLGTDQVPFGEDAGFVQTCFGCHVPVAETDYVFTRPAALP